MINTYYWQHDVWYRSSFNAGISGCMCRLFEHSLCCCVSEGWRWSRSGIHGSKLCFSLKTFDRFPYSRRWLSKHLRISTVCDNANHLETNISETIIMIPGYSTNQHDESMNENMPSIEAVTFQIHPKFQALLRGCKRLTCSAVFNDAVLVFWVLRPCFPATFQSSSPLYTSGQQQVASVLSQSLGELGHGQVSSLCKTRTPNFYWAKSP